jgi:Domain of unknown function (DUF4157)
MNHRMPQLLQRVVSPPARPRFSLSWPSDLHEHEAERVADAVMRTSQPTTQWGGRGCAHRQNVAQRKCTAGEPEGEQFLPKSQAPGAAAVMGAGPAAPPIVEEVLSSGGQGIAPATRWFMESRFNHNFSQVRVHTDHRAAESARAVNALAYTAGHDVVFGAGQFSPETAAGRRLLAHELTHVVQQSKAPPSTPVVQRQVGLSSLLSPEPSLTGITLPTKSLEFAATEAISAANPKIAELVSAYNSSGFGATLKLSADFTEATKYNTAQQREESTQLARRLHSLRDALVSAGVPANQIDIRPPTAYATSAKGQINADVMPGASSGSLIAPGAPKPPVATPKAPPAQTAAPSKSLSDMLSFKFKAGSVEFAVDLPKSVTARLPVALGASKKVAFELKAEASGTFSFSVTLDGVPHVRVRLEAQASVSKDKGTTGSAGLVIETTRTVCHAPSPDSLKADITKAGDDLKTALQAAQAATTNEDKLSKLVDAASAIGDMYDAVDKAKKGCKEEPAATFKFGVQGPLSPPSGAPEETDPSKRPATFIGGSATWYF